MITVEHLNGLIGHVAAGNPGALEVIVQIQNHQTDWVAILEYLKVTGRTGPRLSLFYQNECGSDITKLLTQVKEAMYGRKN